ncbi:MAG: BlaI/MecI/CopY family transcriptional regulator [Pirellulaceae bacterium]|jgi:predicted transcriptional regulator|nr:BlaI/MecI/CopY family transcriptional regulator [Pirellulaceae bacterium]MDP7020165.1 BlaI/MecI/CopY family transcriptional regulator [Pirellulaceae bacterium]
MPQRPALSKAELETARIVWRLGEATVRQVFDRAPPERAWDFKTVQTYLRRLESKGYLKTKKVGRNRVYLPRVKPDQVVRETVDDFVNRLFDGQTLPLFQHMLQDRGVSTEEVQQLRDLIDRWEEQQGAE